MFLINRKNEQKVLSEIVAISETELSDILEEDNFEFDWQQETDYDLYALRVLDNKNTVGLMALKDVKDELRIEIILLESSKDNIGASKTYQNIAGCLIAWACRLAFIKGYYGFVSLIPKTRLIEHYKNAYGFEQFGRQLAVDTEQSHSLIKKYLKNE
jgi:hypothetical protein